MRFTDPPWWPLKVSFLVVWSRGQDLFFTVQFLHAPSSKNSDLYMYLPVCKVVLIQPPRLQFGPRGQLPLLLPYSMFVQDTVPTHVQDVVPTHVLFVPRGPLP